MSAFEEFINYHYRLDIDSIKEPQILAFLRFLITERKVSTSYQNVSINAIKFYYERVLRGQRKFYFVDRPGRDSPRRIKKTHTTMYYYIYVLLSEKDKLFYTGYTSDLKARLSMHNTGRVASTANRRPLKLIYFEGCLHQQDATRREKYLKSGNGKIYIRSRLRHFFNPTG